MKIAIVHDWIIDIGGAEHCLRNICSVFPDADIYTLVFKEDSVHALGIDIGKIKASFIHRLPLARKMYRNYLPLFPLAIEQFDVSGYDVVLSSSHAVAKGVLTTSRQLHICYCHTPMRYAWDLYHQYITSAGVHHSFRGLIARLSLHYLRVWDVAVSGRVDNFIANSSYIARRIKKIYGRDAIIIYPPVDTDYFIPSSDERDDYYLTASRMVPYKRMDIIVKAFSKMPEKKLVVIGDGPDYEMIRSISGRNIELLGHRPQEALRAYMRKARAFVFAAEEDFGIVPVEAQACGTPIIAFGKGGVLETVLDGKTGIFYREQNEESLIAAVNDFERQGSFDPAVIRSNAERFAVSRFRAEFSSMVDTAIKGMD